MRKDRKSPKMRIVPGIEKTSSPLIGREYVLGIYESITFADKAAAINFPEVFISNLVFFEMNVIY